MVVMQSRAVLRTVAPGEMVDCAHCERPVKFAAQQRNRRVIANVYNNGKWVRTEIAHPDCYLEAGEPYGPVDDSLADQMPR